MIFDIYIELYLIFRAVFDGQVCKYVSAFIISDSSLPKKYGSEIPDSKRQNATL